MGVSNTCFTLRCSPSTLNRGNSVRRGINPSSGECLPHLPEASFDSDLEPPNGAFFYYYFATGYRTPMLIVAPISATAAYSRSTAASATSIPPNLGLSREILNNFADLCSVPQKMADAI